MIYEFCPKCGSKHFEQQSNKFVCSDCSFVLYLNPKPTASALIVDGGKVLLGKRHSEPEKGKWDVIGGFLEYGEHPEKAVRREAREETGFDIEIEKSLGIYMDSYGPEKYSTLNICYIAKIVGGEAKPGDDIEELKWFTADELPEVAFQNGKDMIGDWLRIK